MKALYLLALFSAQAVAWPWTTVDDCVEKNVAKAESVRGARLVRFACQEKYGKKNGNDDLAECLLDKVPPAKTDEAAAMINGICQRENPAKVDPYDAELDRLLSLPPVMTQQQAMDHCIKVPQTQATFQACVYKMMGR